MFFYKRCFLSCVCISVFLFFSQALGADSVKNDLSAPGAIYLRDYNKAQTTSQTYTVPTEKEIEDAMEPAHVFSSSVLLNNDVIAYYGHPLSTKMGILGRYTKNELYTKLSTLANEYDRANGDRGVVKAFYIIYGTVWPAGEIGILKESVLKEYIDFAAQHDMLVFIDHQIGKYDPIDSLKRMLPYLQYPNVHLALDPEWRTDKPMEVIGSVSGAEINKAQEVMSDYLAEHGLSGERMLVIHQFKAQMISDRDVVSSNYPGVTLVHCADGFGPPRIKRETYAYLALAANMPVKGFKLFYDSQIPGAGYDSPLLSPAEVLALNPRPYLIMYQ